MPLDAAAGAPAGGATGGWNSTMGDWKATEVDASAAGSSGAASDPPSAPEAGSCSAAGALFLPAALLPDAFFPALADRSSAASPPAGSSAAPASPDSAAASALSITSFFSALSALSLSALSARLRVRVRLRGLSAFSCFPVASGASCASPAASSPAASAAVRVRRAVAAGAGGSSGVITLRAAPALFGAETTTWWASSSTTPAGRVSGAEGAVLPSGSGSGGGPAARTAPERPVGALTLTSASVAAVSVVPAVPSAPPLGSFSSIRAVSRQSPRARLRLLARPRLARAVVAVSAPGGLPPPGQSPHVGPALPEGDGACRSPSAGPGVAPRRSVANGSAIPPEPSSNGPCASRVIIGDDGGARPAA